jgi:DNA modification methylase
MEMENDKIHCGDAEDVLKTLKTESVHCIVTSPPYYGLRDYGEAGQIGREDSPEEYAARLTAVFREAKRVLRPDGTLWLNIADTYAGSGKGYAKPGGCKPKDMIGIPWLLAFALRSDGWYLRNAVVWAKANPMPEGVKDRFTRCYEFVFLLAKSKSYYFDGLSVAKPVAASTIRRMKGANSGTNKYAGGAPGQTRQNINAQRAPGSIPDELIPALRNRRDVWHINTVPYSGAHFAAFPPDLAKTCILAGCPPGGIVLDPFFGSGTTGLAAKESGRHYIGIDLNAGYCRLAEERIAGAKGGDGRWTK